MAARVRVWWYEGKPSHRRPGSAAAGCNRACRRGLQLGICCYGPNDVGAIGARVRVSCGAGVRVSCGAGVRVSCGAGVRVICGAGLPGWFHHSGLHVPGPYRDSRAEDQHCRR